jgi:hypothetical protein
MPVDELRSDSLKARLFLAVACVWPLLVMVLFSGGSSSSVTNGAAAGASPALQLRKYLDRVDIMGYGPTHPRVSFVVVSNDPDEVLTTVESVFRYVKHILSHVVNRMPASSLSFFFVTSETRT